MTDRAPTWARDSATSVLRRSRPRGCGTSRPTCDVGMARAPTGRGTRRDASRPTWDRRNGSRPRGRGTRQREGLDGHAHVGAVPVPLVPRGAVAPWPFRARRDRNLSRAHLDQTGATKSVSDLEVAVAGASWRTDVERDARGAGAGDR